MSDATPTPPTPDPVTPPAPAEPTPAYAATPAAGPKQTMSIVGFVLGLVSFLFSWTGIIGIGAGIAAIIVSQRAKKSEPGAPQWMHTIALVAGIIGIVLGVIIGGISLIGIILTIGAASSYSNY